MTQACLFCRIVAAEVPACVIYEDKDVVAFLDILPIRPGHAQIVPRHHYDFFDDLPASLLAHVGETAQRLAKAMKPLYGVARVGFAFTGGDVAHAHAHVVPLVETTDLTSLRYFNGGAQPAKPQELAREAARLRAGMENLP
jgi:histidine triad (HIT) family protein